MILKKNLPKPSEIYPILWRFAAERHRIYMLRASGSPPPWTSDEVLTTFKFTNAYRAADRVSQFFIRMANSHREIDTDTLFLRTMLFKIFNKIETWEEIVSRLGLPDAKSFDFRECANILSDLKRKGVSIYSGAYIMPSGGVSGVPKHKMHLDLIETMLADHLADRIASTKTLEDTYRLLLKYPSIGPFLAFQYSIDLNYTTVIGHSEMEFVVAGPGAHDGLAKCFSSLGDFDPEDTIRWLTENQEEEFKRYDLDFPSLWGRPLQLIDVQNLLCEISKYTRVSHPEIKGKLGRTRIKKRFIPSGPIIGPQFPSKWGLDEEISKWGKSFSKHLVNTGTHSTFKFGQLNLDF